MFLNFHGSMANCYRCGRAIEDDLRIRRRVKTGEWVRRRYPKSSVSHVQSTFGMRIVCKWCAGQIDRQELRVAFRGHMAALIALATLMVALLLRGFV